MSLRPWVCRGSFRLSGGRLANRCLQRQAGLCRHQVGIVFLPAVSGVHSSAVAALEMGQFAYQIVVPRAPSPRRSPARPRHHGPSRRRDKPETNGSHWHGQPNGLVGSSMRRFRTLDRAGARRETQPCQATIAGSCVARTVQGTSPATGVIAHDRSAIIASRHHVLQRIGDFNA